MGDTMDRKLSHNLLDMGFFSALGTSEHPGMTPEEIHVERKEPFTFDSNNGITVVYDEEGRPWVIHNLTLNSNPEVSDGLRAAISEHGLRRGAYVPHSNDGGHFMREVVMKF